ncbi:MAG: prephenate dehydrogenase/arogenate dehydrogenase family protein [Candidatus Omnitrophica bacterium]|nr:prephenate dehydrogenase/arogenate dehydrogenase family protein [Candidatus Omnitrophota bacterium]
MALFNRITIIGVGLIGGSLGMAIRRKRLAREVVGVVRRPASVAQTLRRGAVDAATRDWDRAVRGADLVVLALPVDGLLAAIPRLARSVAPGTLITDVGSTKAAIVRAMARGLPRGVAFVGGHPLAGSERAGLTAARADLFDDALCFLTPTARTPSGAVARVRRMWQTVGCRVATMPPTLHDRLLARVSHAPHLTAAALSLAVSPHEWRHAGPNLREMTRVAKSEPALWRPIFQTNRADVVQALDRVVRELRSLRGAVARRDASGLLRRLRLAQRRRLTVG